MALAGARSEPDWWRPLPVEIRRWERPPASETGRLVSSRITLGTTVNGDVKLGPLIELDKPAGLQGKELEGKEQELLRGRENPFYRKPPSPLEASGMHS